MNNKTKNFLGIVLLLAFIVSVTCCRKPNIQVNAGAAANDDFTIYGLTQAANISDTSFLFNPKDLTVSLVPKTATNNGLAVVRFTSDKPNDSLVYINSKMGASTTDYGFSVPLDKEFKLGFKGGSLGTHHLTIYFKNAYNGGINAANYTIEVKPGNFNFSFKWCNGYYPVGNKNVVKREKRPFTLVITTISDLKQNYTFTIGGIPTQFGMQANNPFPVAFTNTGLILNTNGMNYGKSPFSITVSNQYGESITYNDTIFLVKMPVSLKGIFASRNFTKGKNQTNNLKVVADSITNNQKLQITIK